ncbi:MAG: hypothetical protein H6922_03870 [Pseudomonadaceae bacterium]|nr:hypothetical protein [Pseudomonadaceae bacterium]
MSRRLVQGILELRGKLDEQAKHARTSNIRRRRDDDAPQGTLRSLQLAADVQAIMVLLKQAAEADRTAYRRIAEFGLPDEAATVAPAAPQVGNGYAAALGQAIARVLIQPAPSAEAAALAPPSQHFAGLVEHEISRIGDEAVMMAGPGKTTLLKLKNAYKAFLEQRYTDVHTILKNTLRNEPNNNALLFLLSQFQYFMVSLGHNEVLPDARDYAQKAMIANDKHDLATMIYFRYHGVATEAQHDGGRAMMWIRDAGLLHVNLLQNEEGLTAYHGMPLKAWAQMAAIDPKHWQEDDLLQLKTMMMDVVGGAAIYAGLLRPRILEDSLHRKEPLPHVSEMESLLAGAYATYEEISPKLAQLPVKTSQMPWLVRSRYMNTLAEGAPKPSFDQILLNISLNAQYWRAGSYPDPELSHLFGNSGMSYWRLWAVTLTPLRERRQPQAFPADEVVADAQLLPLCDSLLTVLQEEEQARIRPDLWDKLQPWFVRWSLEHLLAAGTGSNQPRLKFMPRSNVLGSLYQAWGRGGQTNVLYSPLIAQTASNGGFSTVQEILAAFEGSYRLMDDPAHGIAAMQKRALQQAKKQDPAKFGGLQMLDEGFGLQQIFAVLLPLGLIGGIGAIITMSQNMGQAIGLTLALAGFAGVAMIGLGKKE